MIIKNVQIFDGNPLGKLSDIHISEEGIILGITESSEICTCSNVINGQGMIALPGLTDAHRHVWQAPFKGFAADMMLVEYLNKVAGKIGEAINAEDLYYVNLYGYLQAAFAGITTVFDWSHIMNSPEYADAAVQAAKDSGVNVLFFHSTSAVDREKYWSNSTTAHHSDIERIAVRYKNKFSNVKIGMGARGPEFAQMDINKADITLANALDIPVSMHIGCSILGKIHKPVEQLFDSGLLTKNLNLVHCNTLSDLEFQQIVKAECLVTMTPEAEMQTGLGNPATRFIRDNPLLKWSVGIDIPTASTDSLIFQQRLLLQHYRSVINAGLIDQMILPMEMPYAANAFFFDSMEHANTYAGFNTSAKIKTGSKACFSLLKWNELEFDFFASNPTFYYLQESAIDTVILNGKLAKYHGEWLLHDWERLQRKVKGIAEKVIAQSV